jgi:unsaturated rhamnogalacturonyl hydrolase
MILLFSTILLKAGRLRNAYALYFGRNWNMKKNCLPKILLIGMLYCQTATAQPQLHWNEQIAETILTIWKDSIPIGNPAKWSYDMGVALKGMEGLWRQTKNPTYFQAIQSKMNWFIASDGTIKGYSKEEYNIDNINNGKLLLLLFKETKEEKYKIAARQLREQLTTHPRTKEGGFWHKKTYPYQMWLDGLYMGAPFYAEYAKLFKEPQSFDDITNQFVWMENHARDSITGLLYHAWDESRQQKWSNPVTGQSPHFWGRAMGWYADALVDALDYFPKHHPGRKKLIAILNRLIDAVQKQQDPATGLWYDVMNYNGPGKERNYFEASASSQFVYAIAKGVRKKYVSSSKLPIAQKGFEGILKQFVKLENGQYNLYGTVKVSGLGGSKYRDGSFEYYMSEPVIVNDPKGLGAFLLAANEMALISNHKNK